MFLREKLSFFKYDEVKLKQESISPAGRDLILIMGSTGSGKSTFANYMTGCQLESKYDDNIGKDYLEAKPGSIEICKTEHGVSSVTFYPQVVLVDKNIELLDCPAYNHNGIEVSTKMSAVATQRAIQDAKSVHGIVIMLDYSTLSNKYQYFALTEALVKSVNNVDECKNSFLFLISNAPEGKTLKQMRYRIREFADYEKLRLPDQHSARMMCNLILANPESLLLYDPTVEKQRADLMEQLQKLEVIPKEKFSTKDLENENILKDISKNLFKVS